MSTQTWNKVNIFFISIILGSYGLVDQRLTQNHCFCVEYCVNDGGNLQQQSQGGIV